MQWEMWKIELQIVQSRDMPTQWDCFAQSSRRHLDGIAFAGPAITEVGFSVRRYRVTATLVPSQFIPSIDLLMSVRPPKSYAYEARSSLFPWNLRLTWIRLSQGTSCMMTKQNLPLCQQWEPLPTVQMSLRRLYYISGLTVPAPLLLDENPGATASWTRRRLRNKMVKPLCGYPESQFKRRRAVQAILALEAWSGISLSKYQREIL